jgi:hypothetical protein
LSKNKKKVKQMRERRASQAQLAHEFQKVYRERIVKTTQEEKLMLKRRRSMETIPKNDKLAYEIRERMETRRKIKEIEKLEHNMIASNFIAKTRELNSHKPSPPINLQKDIPIQSPMSPPPKNKLCNILKTSRRSSLNKSLEEEVIRSYIRSGSERSEESKQEIKLEMKQAIKQNITEEDKSEGES